MGRYFLYRYMRYRNHMDRYGLSMSLLLAHLTDKEMCAVYILISHVRPPQHPTRTSKPLATVVSAWSGTAC